MPRSFDFPVFHGTEKDLILQGDASIANRVLRLTREENNGNPIRIPGSGGVGRVLHSAPVQLYDSTVQPPRPARFETTFKFVISSPPSYPSAGNGLAFFIATPETTIPPNSGGEALGLFRNAADRFVAVEFHTHPNPCIRININSIPATSHEWDQTNGEMATDRTARIIYDRAAGTLNVSYDHNDTHVEFAHPCDLYPVLPEWVRVGFSAATDPEHTETNRILSWSFNSNIG